ncbi:hypothetical protein BT96DRAFT_1000930 [Gymnopus androsaceus JB14]|uniref:Uncharacterized protein n=1 Tax=Gymnopus androsaceus JB14 TaxID=1447944 RepID=A0A6A4H0X8_9AGAR|nr:hypothetical protein BT96DRAFT_1000930 [Gymnopus androsaceus JB14]
MAESAPSDKAPSSPSASMFSVEVELSDMEAEDSALLKQPETEKINPDIEQLLGDDYDMQVVEWNGKDSYAIVDREGRIISALAGTPCDRNWGTLMKELEDAIANAREKMSFSNKQKEHIRGEYPSVSMGNSFGGGSKRPGTMAFYGKGNKAILMSVIATAAFQRLVGFTNCIFEAFTANTFGLYRDNLNALFAAHPKLVCWFGGSVFAGCSFNMGPYTVSWPHTDSHNLAFGWCAITALGSFNPDRGGHLILWDLGLIIRFPPGSTILIPSALLTHSNVPIFQGEVRYSIIQYSSSGLFRWVYNGLMSDKDFEARASPEQKQKHKQERKTWWGNGLRMFSLWNDVRKQYNSA